MDTTSDLIGSVEFGDWLLNAMERETGLSKSRNAAVRECAMQRLAVMHGAKQLLLEFLTLQQDMMEFARTDSRPQSPLCLPVHSASALAA